ncbi:MAG TPA: YbhB/YbcL family Raf kinase inhibitor-like protein [Candidatus Saccharimonadales bacterium]|nr:YbhB/YbcL family Raf kinase inhibitor-like protein [Candidatus Saccharimonadales bacterium]
MNSAGDSGLRLTSTAFREGQTIPEQYTCKGQNINPPLNIVNPPAGTQGFAIIMHDPDAPVGDYLHWLIWDIPPSTEGINANSSPVGAVAGYNQSDSQGYMGPCPPAGSGTHRYQFELYALDTTLGLERSANREKLEAAMSGHILDQTTLTGVFAASS